MVSLSCKLEKRFHLPLLVYSWISKVYLRNSFCFLYFFIAKNVIFCTNKSIYNCAYLKDSFSFAFTIDSKVPDPFVVLSFSEPTKKVTWRFFIKLQLHFQYHHRLLCIRKEKHHSSNFHFDCHQPSPSQI